ncbi:hypothetical protein EW026_g4601 [Hermanssonia centrifuga]|uniref:Cyclin-like domain-containing protein n=1 Tax=Hermanssonia centrifuga TaxID=98765 RepID=A0A4S4KGL9_9APHY|nr:hypothetical protein EW026_g4601 [Hermanssonia centrifuga]
MAAHKVSAAPESATVCTTSKTRSTLAAPAADDTATNCTSGEPSIAYFANNTTASRRRVAVAFVRLSCMNTTEHYQEEASMDSPSPSPEPVLDWLTPSTHRSSQFLAEKTCEMICYLWFSTLSRNGSPANSSRPMRFPQPNSATATLQFAVSPDFVRFMQKVLETTQVSQSVIVLSLQYIYRLKERNRSTNGKAGSEFRVAVAALMMANKFVDDNTYTNKTWSEVSGIALTEVNKMEREFLQGIGFDLYVDKASYESWLNLLKGLVMAKEKDSRHWCRSYRPRITTQPRTHRSTARVSHEPVHSQRARSSSPSRTYSAYSKAVARNYSMQTQNPEYYTPPRSGSKRSATDAFSPTSASFPPIRPLKRPTGLSLDIPELAQGPSSAHSVSPSEPLQSLANLSLGASPIGPRSNGGSNSNAAWPSTMRQDPQTLASAYRMDNQRPYAAPQNLYFYALACSPTEEESRTRKARLRYAQPPMTSADYGYATQPTVPMVVQSACASPHEVHGHLPARYPTLPHFSELSWNRPRPHMPAATQPYASQQEEQVQPVCERDIPSAPFANAGPPGVQFYLNNAQQQHTPEYHWSRGRRL